MCDLVRRGRMMFRVSRYRATGFSTVIKPLPTIKKAQAVILVTAATKQRAQRVANYGSKPITYFVQTAVPIFEKKYLAEKRAREVHGGPLNYRAQC